MGRAEGGTYGYPGGRAAAGLPPDSGPHCGNDFAEALGDRGRRASSSPAAAPAARTTTEYRTIKQERMSKRVPAHYLTTAERDRNLRGGILIFPPRPVPFLRLLAALRKHAVLTYFPLEAR